MSENSKRSGGKQENRQNSNVRRHMRTRSEPSWVQDWIEDQDGYQVILRRIIEGKGLDSGWF